MSHKAQLLRDKLHIIQVMENSFVCKLEKHFDNAHSIHSSSIFVKYVHKSNDYNIHSFYIRICNRVTTTQLYAFIAQLYHMNETFPVTQTAADAFLTNSRLICYVQR